ncbi:lipopolysaccharide biosynthesis protein [Oxalobacteraceae bacterium R-40]|uniref:Lipopolysaccharide biosynthesis protein n=1 Tax=Keguizhuia sedimenti TaxID=3064264 RepID=A0ABU1BL63_9BURK|nr:lipopolysaccharide biosynthesis protein [Oxalobacteraceae bacterium R-40]
MLDQVIVSGSNFFTLIYLARHLDVANYGFFSLAMLAMLFLANMQRALITRPLDILGAAEKADLVLDRLLVLLKALWIAIPVAIVVLGALSLQFFPDFYLFLSCACYLLCFLLQEMIRRYWYTINRIQNAVRSDFISYCGQLVIIVGMNYWWEISAYSAFLVMAATSLAAFLFDIRTIDFPGRAGRISLKEISRQHWSISKWLVLTVITIWSAGQIYPLLIASMGPAAVATFTACGNILRAGSLVMQTVDNYLPSRAASLMKEKGANEFRRHLVQTFVLTIAGGAVFVLVIYVFALEILHVVYAGNYDHAVTVLRWMLPGALFTVIGMIFGAYSLAMADSRASFLANLAATAFTMTIGLWSIMKFGLLGAAVASSLTAATSMIVQGGFVFAKIKKMRFIYPQPLEANGRV